MKRAKVFLFIFIILSSYFSSWSLAVVTIERNLSDTISWFSCNSQKICYELVAQDVQLGFLSNYYYTGPVEVKLQRQESSGFLKELIRISSAEAKWDFIQNQWILLVLDKKKNLREFIFNPDSLSEKDLRNLF